jgi:hypothetical protein
MNNAQNEAILTLGGASYSSAGTSVTTFDTRGFRYAVVDVTFGTLATNGGVPSVFRITESDATVISNFTTITGGSATLAAANLAHSTVRFQIDLRNRKRYLNLDITNGTSSLVISAVARLSRPETSKLTAAQQSVTNMASGASTNASVNQIVRIT